MYLKPAYLAIFLFLLLSSCSSNSIEKEGTTFSKYIFIGHCYWFDDSLNRLDPRIEHINFTDYDIKWLGGDLLFHGAKSEQDLNYLQKTFDVKNPNTLWALGNHDTIGKSLNTIESYLNKKAYHTAYKNGITSLALNINYDDCNAKHKQYEFFKNVCDTIKKSKFLVVLSHQLIWAYAELGMRAIKYFNGDGPHWTATCDTDKYFSETIYPHLKKVQQKGIQVIFMSGDMGQKRKYGYEFQAENGIWFLTSGINQTQEIAYERKVKDPDRVLIFNHNLKNDSLSWDFVTLDSLVQSQL